ncbi:MAG: sulfotransferase [Planctomycetota bacterium]
MTATMPPPEVEEPNPTESAADPLSSPVFIVGPLRSGTTLLRLLIDHHPDANVFGEFEGAVSQAVGDDWPDLADYHDFARRDRMMRLNGFAVDESLGYPDLVRSFLAQAHERGGRKPVLGGTIHSRMDLLPKLWPHAKFIHTLRDPRDVARSCIGMGWSGNVYGGAKYWIKPEQHWDKLCAQVAPEQTLDVKYEDLVRDPEAQLTRCCDFLGLAYTDQMLALDRDTTYSRPDPRLAEQWRTKQTPDERRHVEAQCADLMRARGYAFSDGEPAPLTPAELRRLQREDRLNRYRFNLKRWGLPLYLQHVIAKRTGPAFWKHAVQRRIDAIQNDRMR